MFELFIQSKNQIFNQLISRRENDSNDNKLPLPRSGGCEILYNVLVLMDLNRYLKNHFGFYYSKSIYLWATVAYMCRLVHCRLDGHF